MKEVGISPKSFADILARLDQSSTVKWASYLSTHPSTKRRIERALAANH